MQNKIHIYRAFLLFLMPFWFAGCHKVKEAEPSPTNWKLIPYVTKNPDNNEFMGFDIASICFESEQIGYMIGSETYHEPAALIYKTIDGGQTWSTVGHLGCPNGSSGTMIDFSEPGHVFAVNSCAAGFRIWESTDEGLNWYSTSESVAHLGAHFRIDAQHLAMANLKTSNGGDTWSAMNLLSGTTDYFFRDTTYGICVTSDGVVGISTDFGSTWDTLYYASTCSFTSVAMPDANTIVAGGNKIIRSADTGASWSAVSFEADITDIQFTNSTTGFASVSRGKILKTTDGGASWAENYAFSRIQLTTLCVINENTAISAGSGVLVGKGYVIMTTTAGN